MGDYAILIQSGFSKQQALLAQLMTAVGAVLGTMFSLSIAHLMKDPSSWILPLTAGGFIYVATVSVLPDLLKGTGSRTQDILELLGFGAGVAGMFVIGFLE